MQIYKFIQENMHYPPDKSKISLYICKNIFDMEQIGEVLWDEQNDDDMVVPEEHKRIVRERINKYENSPDSYLSWDDIELKMAASH